MLDTTFTHVTMRTGSGRTVTVEAPRPVAIRKFGCTEQAFCPECKAGNHAHVDAYGRPEYHCPSSRPWVGWQRVYFDGAGIVSCSCEHGQVMSERGLPARCAGHALYTLYKIESGGWPTPEDLGGSYPFVINIAGGELFEEEEEERFRLSA